MSPGRECTCPTPSSPDARHSLARRPSDLARPPVSAFPRARRAPDRQQPSPLFLPVHGRQIPGNRGLRRSAAAGRAVRHHERPDEGRAGQGARRQFPADRQAHPRAERADPQHRQQARLVRHGHGHREAVRPHHRPPAQEPARKPRSRPPRSTTSSARMVTSTTSAASPMPRASAISRTPRSGSPRPTTTSGPTKPSSRAT